MSKNIVNSIFWMGGSSVLSQLITWVFTFAVARILSPDDYGLVGMAGVYIGATECLNEFGIGPAIVQRKDLNTDDVKGIYLVAILIGALLSIVTYFISPLVALFFKEPRLTVILQVLSITFVISSAKSVQRNLMIREMRFPLIAKIDLIVGILSAVIALLCALSGLGVWTLVIQVLATNLLVFLGAFWFERQLPGMIQDFSRVKEMLKFGMGITFSRLFSYMRGNIDSVIIGKLLGKSFLGSYGLAQTLANKPFEKILPIFNQVFFPMFSKLQDDKEQVRQYLFRIIEIELLLFLPIFIGITLCADDVIHVALGDKWINAVRPMQVFALLGICKYFESRITIVFTSLGNARVQVYYHAALAITIAIAMLLLGLNWGMVGILLSWLFCYPLMLGWYLVKCSAFLGVPVAKFLLPAQKPLVMVAVMGLVVISIDHVLPVGLSRLLVKTISGGVVYLIINFIFNKNSVLEIMRLLNVDKKFSFS